MSLVIQKPGMLTTVQDLGRYGYRSLGINPGGVMDRTAARLINILLGNEENTAVLEMHFPAAQIEFESDTAMAIGGGNFQPMINDAPIEMWRVCSAAKGDVLKFSTRVSGSRSYLAVAGGIKVTRWLGSASTNLAANVGGLNGRKLEVGDILGNVISMPTVSHNLRVSASLIPKYSRFPTVRIIAGAEHGRLGDAGQRSLSEQDFIVSNNSNRMGYRLEGTPIEMAEPIELISSAVDFGTIQLLPGGQLIVLMADHQTTGGYPRVGHVISHDLPLLAQLERRDKIAFHLIDAADAESISAAFERELSFLRAGCRFQQQK